MSNDGSRDSAGTTGVSGLCSSSSQELASDWILLELLIGVVPNEISAYSFLA